jgi:hypothetical protein
MFKQEEQLPERKMEVAGSQMQLALRPLTFQVNPLRQVQLPLTTPAPFSEVSHK